MSKCSYHDCNEEKVFLETFCWEHIKEDTKKEYANKLLNEVMTNKNIEGQNFRKVVLIDVTFPEFCIFRNCNFQNAFILRVSFQHADLRGSDFTNACIKDCRFQHADFRGISTSLRYSDARESNFEGAVLQNVDMSEADLRDVNLINVDMMGAKLQGTKLYASRIINSRLRKESFCNFADIHPKEIRVGDEYWKIWPDNQRGPCGEEGPDDTEGPKPLFARFVYTMLKNNFRSFGEFDDMRWGYEKEQIMERNRLHRLWYHCDRECDALAIEHWHSDERGKLYEFRFKAFLKWVFELVRWSLAYGINYRRILFTSFSIMVIFSFVFMFSGCKYTMAQGKNKVIDREFVYNAKELRGTLDDFFTACYMSAVTFTTLGYGDTHPIGITRLFASIEAFIGLIMMALLVAVLARNLWTGQ